MAVGSLGQLTVDLVANTAGFERAMTRAERAMLRQEKAADRLTASIDPVSGAMQKLTAQQIKLDELWQKKVIPDQEYKRLSGILAENEKALQRTGAQITKTNAAFDANGLTAKQLANNLRGIPAQFTDIATSLAAGQNPLTVFLQQGGQLKDMFGGIGPAAKALGGYVVGLINPFTVAAATAATLALAYKQGSDETTAFSTALAMTGNTAGTTTAQLSDLAQQISLTGGTVGKAAGVLAQLAASTRIPKEAFESIAVAAIAFEKATGVAAEETVKNFEKIAKDPTAEILKLNETMNFLTATTYEHIKALQEQGNVQEAATVANAAYESGLERTATSVQKNLGYIETGWNAVKSAAKSAWDAALNIGREDTLDQQLKKLDEQLNAIANARRLNAQDGIGNLAPSDTFREEALQAEKTQKLILKAEQDRRAAARGFQQEQQAQSLRDQVELDKLRKETESNADKRARELGQYRELVERRVTQARAAGDKSLLISAEQQAKDIAAINEKYKDPKVAAPKAVREDAGQKLLGTLREQAAALQMQSDSIDEQTGKYKSLGAQAKALAEFEQRIANIKETKIQTADQKSILASEDLLRAQLKRNVALEQEIAARKTAYEDEQKLAAFRENQASKIASAREANQSQLAGLGSGEKLRERLKQDLAIQKEYQNEQDKLEAQRSKGQISPERYAEETTILKESLAERLVDQQDYYNQLDEAQGSFFLGASEGWANWAEEATNFSAQAAEMVTGTLDTLSDGLAESFMSILDGTKSVGEAFSDLGRTMVQAVVGALVKMAAQWLVYQAVQLLVGSTSSAASIAQAGVTGTAIAAAYAPAAALASLASFGSNSIPATAAILSTTAIAEGVALAGMAHDGIDSVPETGTWLLQKGERVTTAQTSAKLDKTLNDIKSPASSGDVIVNQIEDASRAGQTQTREENGQKFIDLWIAKLYSDDDVMEALNRKTGLQAQGR